MRMLSNGRRSALPRRTAARERWSFCFRFPRCVFTKGGIAHDTDRDDCVARPFGWSNFCDISNQLDYFNYMNKKKWPPTLPKPTVISFWLNAEGLTVTGQRSLYLYYSTTEQNYNKKKPPESQRIQVVLLWSCYPDSNWRPHPYQGCALPTEL